MPSFEVNRKYFGPNNSVIIVVAMEADKVTVRRPIDGEILVMSVDEVEAWKSESDRRIYYPADNKEIRTKILTHVDVVDDTKTWVDYLDVNNHLFRVSLEDWQEWRNSLPKS